MARVTPASDKVEVKTFEFEGETYTLKNKFKMFKFFKQLNENPVLAISLALEDESLDRLEELDMDMDDFKALLEAMSQALAGTSAGN
jgi:hypothetical protein